MSNIIAFVSIKGGVGKTTMALETATSLVKHFNKRVLLVDANFSAPNIGLYLDLTNEVSLHDALAGSGLHNAIYEAHGVDIVPSSLYNTKNSDVFNLKKTLEKFKNRYDFIILDSSPNYEELKPVIAAADKIFLVTSPDHVTLLTTLKAAEIARQKKTPIEGIIVNKIRSPRHEYNIDDIEEISKIPVLARVKDHKKMVEALSNKIPISAYDPSNPVSREIRSLASAISGEPESKEGFLRRIFFLDGIINKEKINRDIFRQQQRFYESQL